MNIEKHLTARADLNGRNYDVVIIGGGISGVCLYHHLCEAGYSVLLVEKADFSGGTSQASAMMIWGGLLYLRTLDLGTVWKLSKSRERMLRDFSEWVKPCTFRYLPRQRSVYWRFLVHASLYVYWLLGLCRRGKPSACNIFPELEFLSKQHRRALNYEEAQLQTSDARFVLQWLLSNQDDYCQAINYCPVVGGSYDPHGKVWNLDLEDQIINCQQSVRARCIVNSAGVWADTLNAQFQIDSPYKHVLSKGVFVGIPRESKHEVPLIFDTPDGQDGVAMIPWGPVSLWGPTETAVDTPNAGFCADPSDVISLLSDLNRHLKKKMTAADIVSLRCGVRPLAVHKSYNGHDHPFRLSRRHRVHLDRDSPWISVYGSKITNCVLLAEHITKIIGQFVPVRDARPRATIRRTVDMEMISFPGLDQLVPSATWCVQQEMCCTLEDYLRRRTNISQWVPRGGLGANGEHRNYLLQLSEAFVDGKGTTAEEMVETYERKIEHQFDRVLAEC